MNSSQLALLAIQAALRGGNIVRRGFGTKLQVQTKSSIYDLVTEYDHRSEAAIWELLSQETPGSALLAEERGYEGATDAELVWVVDPLDGTVNFAHSIPIFGISVAAVVRGRVEAGVIYQPMTEELFVAERGRGAYLNGEKIAVSTTSEINRCFATTSLSYHRHIDPERSRSVLAKIAPQTQEMRALGAAVLNIAYTAAGRFDAFWSTGGTLSPWDLAAGALLIEEAGGVVSQCNGEAIDPLRKSDLLVSNPHLHPLLLEMCRNYLDTVS
jgi:myo-inositol-1(or 4)-monophosphatase